jgi:SAM-dependent methyltransferase
VAERRFTLDGHAYRYLWDRTGTWRSERAVELPVAIAAAREADPARMLEVGNVLRRYTDLAHAVIDKYERAPWIENADAETFRGGPYDLIVSVSTIEHIGFDETPRDPSKVIRAVENLRGLLAPGGRMLATVPLGYNRDLDDALTGGALSAKVSYLMRRAKPACWEQDSREEARRLTYGWPWGGASAIAVAWWEGSGGQPRVADRPLTGAGVGVGTPAL